MSFFKRLSSMFDPRDKRSTDTSYWYMVQCNRCGEKIQARIDMRNDPSINYGESDQDTTYFCRKVLMGEGRCFQQIEVEFTFDKNHQLIDRQIRGGKFVDEE